MKAMKEFNKLFFIFLCLFNHIISQSCTYSAPFTCTSNDGSTCKYKFPNSCEVCSSTDGQGYYTFYGNTCSGECTGDKLIDTIQECTSADLMSSGLFYQLGDVYYTTNPSDTNIECATSKVCKCKANYYITYYSGKKQYNCFSSTDSGISSFLSTYNHYNYKTKEFFSATTCPDDIPITKQETIDGTAVTRCSDKCLDDEFYNYNSGTESCTDSCTGTGYGAYIVNGVKKCVNCEDVHLYNKDGNCVTLDKCSFYSGSTCYTACGVTTLTYHNYGSKECISGCATTGEYKYSDDTNKICYKKEQCDFIVISGTSNLCYFGSCPSGNTKHSFDSNICLPSCPSDKSYYKSGDNNICYPSCLTIPGGDYIYELDNYECKNSVTSTECPFYHIKNDGVKRCYLRSDCISKGYKYFIDQECRESCDGYYKMDDTETTGGSTLSFTKCYENLEKAKLDNTMVYYNTNLKRCWKTFPTETQYYIKGGTGPYEIVVECENYYYENTLNGNTNLYCTNDCLSKSLFFISGNKKCETSCTSFSNQKYYYDPTNNECIDSCKGRSNPFQNPILTTAQACISSCSVSGNINTFYNYDSNICLPDCQNGGDNDKLYYADGGNICYPSCLEIPGDYLYEFDNYICKNAATGCTYFYIKSNGIKRCVTVTSDCISKNYNYLIGNQCTTSCDDNYYKLTDSSIDSITRCFSTPADCLDFYNGLAGSSVNKIYYNTKLKKCWSTYQTDYFVQSVSSDVYELVEECDKFYYVNSADNNRNYCTTQCGTGTGGTTQIYFVSGSKNCEDSCTDFNKKYYNPTTYECLDTCKGLTGNEFEDIINTANPTQPCKSACATGRQYYDYDSNICLTQCGQGNQNYLYHTNTGTASQDNICYPSCEAIHAGEYKYESKETGTNIKICSTADPVTDCNYYYVKSDGTTKCLDTSNDCLTMNYNYLLGKECKKECNDLYKLQEIGTTGLIQCFKTRDECLKSTANSGGGADYYNTKLKKCWQNFPDGYYLSGTTDTVDSNIKYEVVEECEKYYFENSNSQNQCVDKCSNSINPNKPYFVSGQKNCEDSCTNFYKYFYDITNGEKECLDTCIGRTNEYADEASASDLVKPCQSGCITSGKEHYNYGSKICINSCASGKLTDNSDPSGTVCYNSCKEIPDGDHIYENPDSSKCYSKTEIEGTSPPTDCSFYYQRLDGTWKCITSSCDSNGYDYLYEKECKKNCDNYYILMDEMVSGSLRNTKECYQSLDKAFNSGKSTTGYYYDTTSKKVWINYPTDYFIKGQNGNNYEVTTSCENFYYENSGKNYCTSSCKNVGKFFQQGNKKCEDSCTSTPINKNYYDPTNNECLDTCIGRTNLEYAHAFSTTPQECIQKCPKYWISITSGTNNIKQCVDTCLSTDTNYNHIDVKTSECKNGCGSDQYEVTQDSTKFCYPQCQISDGYKYISSDNYECLLACPSNLKKYEKLDTTDTTVELFLCKSSCAEDEFRYDDKCVKKCPEDYNYIGFNRECKQNCNEDAIGKYYYPTNEATYTTTPGYKIYQCVSSCSETTTAKTGLADPYLHYIKGDVYECFTQCPTASPVAPFYLDSNINECLFECPQESPFYNRNTPNYKCQTTNTICPTQYFYNGNCYSSCTAVNKNYYDSRNICLDACGENQIKQNINNDGTYKCIDNCLSFIYQANENAEPECVTDCPQAKNYFGSDKICKVRCDNENEMFYHKYTSTDTSITYDLFQCVDGCKDDFKYREIDNGYKCFDECSGDYIYLAEDEFLCYDNCLRSEKNPFTIILTRDTNGVPTSGKCADKCDSGSLEKNYGRDKVCRQGCGDLVETPIIDIDNKCVEKCDYDSDNRFELDQKCVQQCGEDSSGVLKLRYSALDYKCKEKCSLPENIVKSNECVSTCDDFKNPITFSGSVVEEYECRASCIDVGKYYKHPDNTCLDECESAYKVVDGKNLCVSNCGIINSIIQDNAKYYLNVGEGTYASGTTYDKCVTECTGTKPYILEDECVTRCPSTGQKKYFVENGINTNKFCLNDCPKNYPYYKIINYGTTNALYPCKSECINGFFIKNEGTSKNATLCVTNCPDTDYGSDYSNWKYKYIYQKEDGSVVKECRENCPSEAKYHIDFSSVTPTSTDDNECHSVCPEQAPYHKRGEDLCLKLSELSEGILLYDIKEWVGSGTNCPDEYPLYTVLDSRGFMKVCLKECNFIDDSGATEIFYGYKTPYKTCVADCTSTPNSLTHDKYLINDEINQECICVNYFYISDSNFEIVCYPSTTTSCASTGDHQIPLFGTKQCLTNCNGRIFNPSEDVCYEVNTNCSEIASYTKLKTLTSGQQKCDCAYKFYYDSGQKHCLSKDSVCNVPNKLLIPDTLQCVSSCPTGDPTNDYPYQFQNFCLNKCPLNSVSPTSPYICECGDHNTDFWYQASEGNYECLSGGGCPDGFPLYAPTTHQCLKSCKDSFYYKFFFEYKCFDTCNQYDNMQWEEKKSEYADYQCFCNKPWFYYIDITDNNEKKVNCPADNDNSINRCEDYHTPADLGYAIPFMVADTRECVKVCPSNYPYYFNHKCYNSCENADTSNNLNIKTASSSFECVCKNLWYIDAADTVYQDKICYNEDIDECPPTVGVPQSTRHLIYETKKCVDSVNECSTSSFKFNMTCYNKCPEFTLDVEDISGNKICKCDTTYYLYLEYEKYGNTYYRCGLKSCPDEFIVNNQEEMRKNLLKSENKCVKFCKNDGSPNYIWSFRNVCVTECPYLTNPVSGDGIIEDNECKFYDIEDETSTVVIDLNSLKAAANIKAKELYEEAESISGYLMNKFDASMQIYAVDKLHDYKDYIMQSNLTYIDLGTCLDKIYQANNLDDGDKLLIAKYDLLTRAHYDNNGNIVHYMDEKFLINPVEYEFYLESTMDKIEGSICSPHEIEISYPIFFNKNKFNNFQNGINDNIYLKQFLMGKELNSKNSEIDTFNKDNKVYKDLCTGAEINGKDLVFEDRYYTLYPNNVSLCESNCTMKNTDFDLERINCLCTYKEIMDFDRIDEDNNDLLNNPDFYRPSQSSANVEVVKCLAKIGVKEGLVNNEAFYIIGSFALIEIGMMIISFAHSMKYIARFIRGLIWNNEAKSAFSLQKNNQIMSSTHRLLNNPPKKGEENDNNNNEEEEKEESNKGNIVIKKNIKMNYNKNNNNDNDEPKDEISEMSINNINNNISNSSINYNLNIKPGLPKSKNKNNNLEDMNYSKSKFIIKNNNTNTNNANDLYTNKKAEFIPLQYNFKFFKPEDKGIIKKIERSKIPFRVNKDTKILLEGKKNVLYDENYLKGPFYQDQNIIEIIDEPDNAQTQKTIKFTHLNNNLNSDINNTNNNIIKKNNNKKNEVEKSIEEETPKKKTIINNINSAEKDFIKIKKINPIENLQIEDYKTDDEVKNVDRTTSIYNLMRREHTYLRVTYEKYTSKNHPNILATFLAEILDKIYFIKIFIFLKKFDIFSIHLALYMFYHIFLLSLLCGFFTIKTIKKIWEESDFPNLSFYLLYGLIANIIVWVFYKVFILLLDNQDKIRALVRFHKESINSNISRNKMEENNEMNNDNEINENKINNINNQQDIINERYEELVKKIKIQTIIFYIIILLLSGFFYIYLVSFFAIYTGTKRRVLTAYYVSIIEIILIKFVYGLCLASLRIAGEANELKSLYKFVYIMDKYVS